MANERLLTWPRCGECALPSPQRRKIDGKMLCLHCEFLAYVRQNHADMADTIEALRERCLCAYCGEYSAEKEHVVPKSSGLATFIVPACRECNGIASDHLFTSFNGKLAYIKKGLSKKYSKLLRMPEWDGEELEEMGHNMKNMIEKWEVAREVMLQRMAWNPMLNS